jgi:hypothetical protein
MKAALVVECEVFADAGFRLAAIGVAPQIDVLTLERPPNALDEHIVHPAPSPVHGDADPGLDQHAGEGRAGELAALVGVEDLRFAVSGQRVLQRTQNDASIVFDSRQERTARLAQWMTATR